mmetsp:Transcript_29639/g.45312  ORF Transcript_29639/g.45312 Transcript_29639/m.45312 type:complete len:261 (-) Transcript_29639:208-990(-)
MKSYSLSSIATALVALSCSQSVSSFAPLSTSSAHSGYVSGTPTISSHEYSTKLFGKRKGSLASAYDEQISSIKTFLNLAVETKNEDPDEVLNALESLEKLMREKRKAEGEGVAQEVLDNLTGDWRLIFTTGTKKTQDRSGNINYFPLKAIQSFTDQMEIENGIYLFDFEAIKFKGDFEFSLKKSKLEFNFDQISIFGFTINLKKDEAAKIGASTGLGAESNVKNAQKDKKAFFNWISADDNIATARGGGGGIALWQRVTE